MKDREEIEAKFRRRLRDEMQEEPPEIRRKVEENIWDLFGEEKDKVEVSITVKWSEEEGEYMALDHLRDASAFGDSPAEALRELATVLELYAETQDE